MSRLLFKYIGLPVPSHKSNVKIVMAAAGQVALSNKGKPLEYDDAGYEYSEYHTNKAGEVLYSCITRNCKGKAKFVNGKLTMYADHLPAHLPPDHAKEVRLVKQKVVEDRKSGVPTETAVQHALANAPPHLLPLLKPSALAQSARRSVAVPGMSNWPATIDPTPFAFTFLREDNCHLHPKGDERAFKLMYSDFGIALLKRHPDWAVDGTFYSAPLEFEQILVIGVQEGHLFTPCAFAFLTSKTAAAYENVFRWLRDHGRVNGPTSVTTDFEIGLTNGFRAVYPRAHISRCAFHLYQAVFRKIQALRLTDLYRGPNTKAYFKGLMALSMLTPADIPRYFEDLKAEAIPNVPQNMAGATQDLFDYFERNYIGVRAANGIRASPTHPMDTWSIHARILARHQIGNSTIEGFNSKLKTVPKETSAQKVASILAEIDRSFEARHQHARLQNLTIVQAFPQSAQTSNIQSRRHLAVANGPLPNQTLFDHLKALATHISEF